jgi:hypothetical protein
LKKSALISNVAIICSLITEFGKKNAVFEAALEILQSGSGIETVDVGRMSARLSQFSRIILHVS